MPGSRPYIVIDRENIADPPRIVYANYEDSAVRHVASTRYTARIASRDDLVAWLTRGVRVEYANGATAHAPDPEPQLPLA